MPPLPNSAVEKPLPILPEQNMAQKRTTTISDDAQGRTQGIPNGNGVVDDRSSYHLEVGSNLYKEEERLKTFREGHWPVEFLKAEIMAAAGFYYLKKSEGDDTARCIFCGIEVGRWVRGDNPWTEHERWSPSCRLIKKLPCGNIPLVSTSSSSTNAGNSQSTSETQGYDVCGNFSVADLHNVNPSTDNSNKDKTSMLEKHALYQKMWEPSFPNYGTYDARIRSYESWPISLKLKPDALSSAGFFYTGRSDQTVCFHCGGGLKDWEDTDDPWVEHARWFSKCPFVLLVKGKDFVEESLGTKQPKEQETSTSELKSCSSTGDLERQSTSTNYDENLSQSSGVFSQSSNEGEINNSTLCKICYAEEMGVVFLPCGHLVACTKCALSLRTCAMCREPVTGAFRAFLS